MDLFHLPDAARQLGISYPTLKQWIYKRRIQTVKTPGGHHRIPRSEIDKLLFRGAAKARSDEKDRRASSAREAAVPGTAAGLEHYISGRNQLVGRIVKLENAGLLAKVVLDVGGQTITSIITRDASRDLGLKVGEMAAALIKATEVMIIRPIPKRS